MHQCIATVFTTNFYETDLRWITSFFNLAQIFLYQATFIIRLILCHFQNNCQFHFQDCISSLCLVKRVYIDFKVFMQQYVSNEQRVHRTYLRTYQTPFKTFSATSASNIHSVVIYSGLPIYQGLQSKQGLSVVFYEKVLFTSQLSSHLMRKLLKNY